MYVAKRDTDVSFFVTHIVQQVTRIQSSPFKLSTFLEMNEWCERPSSNFNVHLQHYYEHYVIGLREGNE